MATQSKIFVAREKDVAAVMTRFNDARSGIPAFLRLLAPFGGGRRAVMGEVLTAVSKGSEDVIIWRVSAVDHENGVQWLVRMYGSLIATLTADVLRRGRVELLLNSQLPSQPKRVQGWYREFISALKESETDHKTGSVKLKIPKDNPMLALIEIVAAIARKTPIIFDYQNGDLVHSIAPAQFIEALQGEVQADGGKLLAVIHGEPESDATKAIIPAPMLDYFTRANLPSHNISAWGAEEVQEHLSSKGLSGDAAKIAELATGRPGFIAEIIDILVESEQLSDDLSAITLESLIPKSVDEDELEGDKKKAAENARKYATAEDLDRVAFIGALLGSAFPSNIVADIGGYDRESIDDLIDAAGDLFEEVQFSKGLNTWIYKFTRGTWREAVLASHDNDEGHELARSAGQFMERSLVPRGAGFLTKTVRVYAEHGELQRATMLKAMALGRDNADVWGMGYDLINYFDDITWPSAMRRTVFMNLIENLNAANNLDAAQKIHESATTWASEQEDKEFSGWLLLTGSRIDARRKEMIPAREGANKALAHFQESSNQGRIAETLMHIAQLELSQGNGEAAVAKADEAIEAGKIKVDEEKVAVHPNIVANAELIKGRVARSANDLDKAVGHFQQSNAVAGQANIQAVAVNAGVALGEALLASGKNKKALEVLRQMVKITRMAKAPMQERSANELLAAAEGSARNFPDAVKAAERALEISRGLTLNAAIPLDMFNLGRFQFLSKKPAEALALFKAAEPGIAAMEGHPVIKEFYYFQGIALLQTGDAIGAKSALETARTAAQAADDIAKVVSCLDHLATIEKAAGQDDAARTLLNTALNTATQANMKEARKSLKKRLAAL
jgi:tetratricopeptide (TPR) repeat protein